MRISDWSSDVCSSDLQGAAAIGRVVGNADPRTGRQLVEALHLVRIGTDRGDDGIAHRHDVVAAGGDLVVEIGHVLERVGVELAGEIGRASCRGSVCQNVWISVVAVAVKKKT